jgi:hypothetical protein
MRILVVKSASAGLHSKCIYRSWQGVEGLEAAGTEV